MQIKFILTSQIATMMGKDETQIEIPENTNILNAIKILFKNQSEDLLNLVFKKDNELLPAILIILNGNQIDLNEHATLKTGDEIMIFSPMSGG